MRFGPTKLIVRRRHPFITRCDREGQPPDPQKNRRSPGVGMMKLDHKVVTVLKNAQKKKNSGLIRSCEADGRGRSERGASAEGTPPVGKVGIVGMETLSSPEGKIPGCRRLPAGTRL